MLFFGNGEARISNRHFKQQGLFRRLPVADIFARIKTKRSYLAAVINIANATFVSSTLFAEPYVHEKRSVDMRSVSEEVHPFAKSVAL